MKFASYLKSNRQDEGIMMRTALVAVVSGAAALWSVETVALPIMHVHDGSGNLATVDAATGDVNVIGSMGVVMTDIAFDPTGDLFGLSFGSFYSIDAGTATATFIGAHGIIGANALVFGTDGTLYAAGFSTTSLYTINPATGTSTDLGDMGFASAGDLAFNNGSFFLASSSNQLVRIDLGNIANTSAVGSFGVVDVFGLATGVDGVLYAVADTTIYEVDATSGAVTDPISFAGQGLGTAFGESFFTEAGAVPSPTPVPEPGTLALLGLGIAGIGFMRQAHRLDATLVGG